MSKFTEIVHKVGAKPHSQPPMRAVTGLSFTFTQFEEYNSLIIRECLDTIEKYEVPVGNSPAGELACEWTMDALRSVRDEIMEKFGDNKD